MHRGPTTRSNRLARLLALGALAALAFFVLPAGAAEAATSGDIIITEIMYDPDLSDNNAEWVEVYNTTGSAIDLNGFTVADNTTTATIGSSVVVPSGGYAVLCRNDDVAVNGGVTCDYEYDNSLGLNNFAETVTVADGATVLDVVAYDDGGSFPDAQGAAISLDPTAFTAAANDDGANWCLAITPLGDDRGTPGSANPACPTTSVGVDDLVISEIMYDPDLPDTNAEWIEVHNTTGSAIDMNGLLLAEGSRYDTITSSVVVPAGGYAVLCRNDDSGANGGITCDYDYDNNVALNNFPETVQLQNNDRSDIDAVAYDDGLAFPDAFGQTISLDPGSLTAAANDDGANWCLAITPFGDTRATPGSANPSCPVTSVGVGNLVISEIMYDPWPSAASVEWVEVYNPTGSAIDMNGLLLSDTSRTTTIISSVVVPAGGYAVLCQSGSEGDTGGVPCNYFYDGNVILNNFAEVVTIANNDRTGIDSVPYDDGGAFPDADGVAIALSPTMLTAVANDSGANWCSAVAAMQIGAGTPGAPNDACTDTYSCGSISGTSNDFNAAGRNLIVGTAGDDNIALPSITVAPAVITFGGNDNVVGSNSGDLICLGSGNDVAIGRGGDDMIYGGDDNDLIAGNNGDDLLSDDDGNDTIYGGSGDDVITGGIGADVLGGASGADTVSGGNGADVISGGSDDDISVSGGGGADAVNGGGGDDTVVTGDAGNDTVSGNGGDDVINGGDGDDQMRGGPGDDQVFGDAGDDFVSGNADIDLCDGGTGVDTANTSNCETIVNVP